MPRRGYHDYFFQSNAEEIITLLDYLGRSHIPQMNPWNGMNAIILSGSGEAVN